MAQPDLAHLHQPGCCPRCGENLCPDAKDVLAGGAWTRRDQKGNTVTGGHVFSYQCPRCGIALLSFPDGWPRWQEVDPSLVRWYPQEPDDSRPCPHQASATEES
jgi:hypothetical protein